MLGKHKYVRNMHQLKKQQVIGQKYNKKKASFHEQTLRGFEDKRNPYERRKRDNKRKITGKQAKNQITKAQLQFLGKIYQSLKPSVQLKMIQKKPMSPIRYLYNNSKSTSYSRCKTLPNAQKPNNRYSTQIQNIRLVQRILLMKPDPETSRNRLSQFYKQQQKYKKIIQSNKQKHIRMHSIMMHPKQWQ